MDKIIFEEEKEIRKRVLWYKKIKIKNKLNDVIMLLKWEHRAMMLNGLESGRV